MQTFDKGDAPSARGRWNVERGRWNDSLDSPDSQQVESGRWKVERVLLSFVLRPLSLVPCPLSFVLRPSSFVLRTLSFVF